MKAGFEYAYREPGGNSSSWYGIMATSWFHVVGSNGSHGLLFPHGHVPFWKPAVCDSSMRIVMLSIIPYGSCMVRSSGTQRTIRSSSESFPRSRSCMIEIAVSDFVIEPQWKMVWESTANFAERSASPVSYRPMTRPFFMSTTLAPTTWSLSTYAWNVRVNSAQDGGACVVPMAGVRRTSAARQ
jgi:hypothetical protein